MAWGRRLRDAGFQLERPFITYPQIMDYIEEASSMETDGAIYAQQQQALAWLRCTFESSNPIVDCLDTSSTCPRAFVKGKPTGCAPCPVVWTGERVYDEFCAANPPPEGTAMLQRDKFFAVLRKEFEPHKNVKNRHLNAFSREAYFVKKRR